MAVRTVTYSFAFGAVDSEATANLDLEWYSKSCLQLENFLLTRSGAIRKRLPFDAVPVDFADEEVFKCVPWAPDVRTAIMTVFTPGKIYLETGEILDNPYSAEDIENLQYTHNSRDMIVTTGHSSPHVLTISNGEIVFVPVNFLFGATRDQNLDVNITIHASANSGNITLTSNTALFDPSMVGGIWGITEPAGNLARYSSWIASSSIALNAYRRNDNKLYKATNAATTGNIPPTHDVDGEIISDGSVKWLFINRGIGYAKITEVISATSANATVQRLLPPTVVSGASGYAPTYRWNEGAWSSLRGFPKGCSFFQNALYLGGIGDTASTMGNLHIGSLVVDSLESFKNGTQRIWKSVTGNFRSFDTGNLLETDSKAIDLASDRSNPIVWLKSTDRLMVGTEQGIFPLANLGEVPGRSVSDAAAPTQAQLLENSIIYVRGARSSIKAARFDENTNSYTSEDLNIINKSFVEGIKEIAVSQSPDNIVLALREDGKISATLVNFTQQTLGLYVISNSEFIFKSISVLSLEDGDYLYTVVYVPDESKYYLGRMLLSSPYTDADGTAIDFGIYTYAATVKTHRISWEPLSQSGLSTGFFNSGELSVNQIKVDVFETQDLYINGIEYQFRTSEMELGEYSVPRDEVAHVLGSGEVSEILLESRNPLTCNIRAVEVTFGVPDN